MKTSLYEKAKKIRFNAVVLSSFLKSGRFNRQFRMRGLSFDSIRDYIPGDDIRFIDWNATARFGKPYSKEFVEDSNVPIMLVVDVSASVTAVHAVYEKVLECALLLLYAGMHQNIPVGCALFGIKKSIDISQDVIYIKPEASLSNYHRIENLLLSFDVSFSGVSKINDALFLANKKLHPGALVFVLSDFYIAGYQQYIAMLKALHTVVGVRFLHDSSILPQCALHARDAESGRSYLLLSNSRHISEAVKERNLHIESELYAVFNTNTLLEIALEQDVFMLLTSFLKKRKPI